MHLQCTQRFGVPTQSTITIRNILSVEFLLAAEGVIASMKHTLSLSFQLNTSHKYLGAFR